jgi:hypothetical protein
MRGLTLADPAAAPACSWLCGPPQGPSTPFGAPRLVVFDSLRVICVVAAVVAAALAVAILRRRMVPGQRSRFLALTGFSAVVIGVEIEHLGDDANWRLIVAIASTLAAAWGNYSAYRMEAPAKSDWRGPPHEGL